MKLQITEIKTRRAVAFWIDEMIIGMPMVALFPIPQSSESPAFLMALTYSLIWLCPLLFRDIFGRSIGKICMGLEIISDKTDNKLSILQRIFRNVTFPLTTFEGIFLFLSADERRWGDKLAGTMVKIKTK